MWVVENKQYFAGNSLFPVLILNGEIHNCVGIYSMFEFDYLKVNLLNTNTNYQAPLLPTIPITITSNPPQQPFAMPKYHPPFACLRPLRQWYPCDTLEQTPWTKNCTGCLLIVPKENTKKQKLSNAKNLTIVPSGIPTKIRCLIPASNWPPFWNARDFHFLLAIRNQYCQPSLADCHY